MSDEIMSTGRELMGLMGRYRDLFHQSSVELVQAIVKTNPRKYIIQENCFVTLVNLFFVKKIYGIWTCIQFFH